MVKTEFTRVAPAIIAEIAILIYCSHEQPDCIDRSQGFSHATKSDGWPPNDFASSGAFLRRLIPIGKETRHDTEQTDQSRDRCIKQIHPRTTSKTYIVLAKCDDNNKMG